MLSLEPRDQLVFEGPFGSSVSKNLVIKNPGKKQSVAFKLKTTSPHLFFVRPNVGVLEPDQTVSVNITMQPTASNDGQKRHKFLIMAAKASGPDINLQDFWKEQKPSDIWDAKIKCEIVPERKSNKASNEHLDRALGGATDSPSKQDGQTVVADKLEEALKGEVEILQDQGIRPKQRGRNMFKFACCVLTIIAALVGAYYGKHYL
ncbi:vesicle-associated membrane protein-associated protein B/C-like [Drosophila kikkawai]|uniref:Vesicle-associated membrane protein-associated protein B/C-like n=1 Tax=Drosophila kikkawai TaxID=30033 RepID=A0A6P4HWZ0_DROKI|nr:vesicle-associated membrane protein-associated protein B/C-like [Drosophila kikkawai]KAH8351665.1 hypothetical protein KR059_011066 [Drosophila kikkawai]